MVMMGVQEVPTPTTEGQAPAAFRLYVSGNTLLSARAIVNIRAFCEVHCQGGYELEVLDVLQDPNAAIRDQILALPTLVVIRPVPGKRFIGDLSDTERLLALFR
jgi:circadian clock protein KaiB